MTQFPHDEFAKDLLRLLLEAFGRVEVERAIGSEARAIDLCFFPTLSVIPTDHLGILSRLAVVSTAFEPYRNPTSAEDIRDCLGKLFDFRKELRRQSKRDKMLLATLPHLWIITPTLAATTLREFGAIIDLNVAESGVYLVPPGYKAGIVVIHQLPATPDTLWLRLLGKNKVQAQAIEETYLLPHDSPYRQPAVELLAALKTTLENNRHRSKTDQELLMSLITSPLYLEHVQKISAQGKAEGKAEGEAVTTRSIATHLLAKKLGNLPTNLQAQIDDLSIDRTRSLIDALLDFNSIDDLKAWLVIGAN